MLFFTGFSRSFHGCFTVVSRTFHAPGFGGEFDDFVWRLYLNYKFSSEVDKSHIDYSEEHHLDPCKLARIQKLNLKAGSKLPASISAFKKAATSLRFACFHLHGGGLNILASASADAGDVGLDPYVVLGPRLRLPSQQPASRWNLGPGTGQVLGPSAHL